MKYPRVSLEQWGTFATVVEAGSFARAAELLNKSQSAVSYAMAKMEQQLPVPVLRQEGRRAVLTEAGEVLYRRAQQLLALANDVEQTAHSLAEGWATQITLALDAVVPIEPVLLSMQRFSERAAQTRVVLLETTLSGTDEALLERRADIAITPTIPPGFFATPISEITTIAVAHPNHPLAGSNRPLSEQDLRQSRQIVIRDSGLRRTQDQGWLGAEQRITVSHFATAIKAVAYGLGFAFVPHSFVKTELQQGSLVRLQLPLNAQRRIPLHMVLTAYDQAGPALSCFIEILQQSFREVPHPA